MKPIFTAYCMGAQALQGPYTEQHARYGIAQTQWDLLTQAEPWNVEQRSSIRSVLGEVMAINFTIAGLPAMPMPGQYAAMLIATLVAPVNRIVAATRCPETFDAELASGLHGPVEVQPMKTEQLVSLVMVYSGEYFCEPHSTDTEATKAVAA